MNAIKLIIIFTLILFSNLALAYGSTTSSKKACKKPTLTKIMPAHLSAVAPEAKFSFHTSIKTQSQSIKVLANKIPVEVSIKETADGFNVSGQLPASIKKKYVRVNVEAITTSRCHGIDGWLLKIEPVKP